MKESDSLKRIVFQFTGHDDQVEIRPLGKGHINDSYKVVSKDKDYVLQRINHQIFKNVPELQLNIFRVTHHIRAKLEALGVTEIDRKVLTLVPTIDGVLYYKESNGDYWRLMDYIKESNSYDEINPQLAYRAGMAFGEFQKMLADLPGDPLFDFGDFIRTGANTGAEDDQNLDHVAVDLAIFEGYAKGYLKNAASFLTDVEIEHLAFGAKLLTYMQAVRFFTDYINGDTYYKIAYPDHNLVRTKAQFKLLQSLEENFGEMQRIVSEAAQS